MDNLTHSLVGALIGQAGLKRKTGLAMPALVIGANIPDVDVACLLWLDGVQHLGFRRGITHGPIAWLLLPLALAGLLWAYDRWQAGRGRRPEGRLPVHFGWLYALSFIACLSHPALDWLNVYGIRLLEPFSSRWFYGDVLFIIDVWLWALLIFSVWFSLRREKQGGEWRRPARIAMAAMLGYIGVNLLISQSLRNGLLVDAPHDQVIISPVPLEFWSREIIVHETAPPHYEWGGNNMLFVNDPKPTFCKLNVSDRERQTNPDLDAFLFWSRAPFAERAPDGSVLIRDARFYDPRAKGRFTVALPDVKCEPLQLSSP